MSATDLPQHLPQQPAMPRAPSSPPPQTVRTVQHLRRRLSVLHLSGGTHYAPSESALKLQRELDTLEKEQA